MSITPEAYIEGERALTLLTEFRDEVHKNKDIWDEPDREMVDQVFGAFSEKQQMMNYLVRLINARIKVLKTKEELVKYFPELMVFFAKKHKFMVQMRDEGNF